MANKSRPADKPLRCILNGLGKDAAMIISRINGFTYVQTQFDYFTGELKEVKRIAYSNGPRAAVNCYGADDVREGVAQQTQHVSSTQQLVHTRRSVSVLVSHTSQ